MITEEQTAALEKKRAEKKEKEAQDSPAEKREVVMHGATLKCKYAQGFGKLFVTSNELLLQDQKWATEGDGNNMVNLQFKGTCGHPKWPQRKMSPPPCMSVIKLTPWQNLGTNFLQEQKNLVKESYIECEPEFNTAVAKPIPRVQSIKWEAQNLASVTYAYFARVKGLDGNTVIYEQIKWGGVEDEIYVIVRTTGLIGKTIQLNVLDKDGVITSGNKYGTLSCLQDESDKKGNFKTTVNSEGLAIFKLEMKPSKDEKAIKDWRDKIGATKDKIALLSLLVDAHTANPDLKITYFGKNPDAQVLKGDPNYTNVWQDKQGEWFELRRKNPVIVIDAGHGGDDPGVLAYKGTKNESDITLSTVKFIKDRLLSQAKPFNKIVLTRETNINPGGKGQKSSLIARVKIAKDNDADIFVAIHVNSADNGTTVNEKADYVRIYSKKSSNDLSILLRDNIVTNLKGVVVSSQGTSGAEESHHVTREQEAKVGATLVEIGFITNLAQETLMNDDNYLKKIGNAIADAVTSTVLEKF